MNGEQGSKVTIWSAVGLALCIAVAGCEWPWASPTAPCALTFNCTRIENTAFYSCVSEPAGASFTNGSTKVTDLRGILKASPGDVVQASNGGCFSETKELR